MSEQIMIEMWGIVELMGRVRLAGLLTEENHFGAVLGRIDIPQADGSLVTQWFGGNSVYRITPVAEQIARDIALSEKPKPINAWELSHLLPSTAQTPMASQGDGDDDADDDDSEDDSSGH
jgi:hypothetical protein